MFLKDIKIENEHRSALFWAWNGNLEESELLNQIDDFKSHGSGGFFMHSREGLETTYLSDEWFRLSKVCSQKAHEIGLSAYLYDEDKWPSGMAGGLVTKMHPEYAAKAIVLKMNTRGCQYEYHTEVAGDVCYLNSGSDVIGIDVESSGPHDWYNGFAPADNLDANSVRAFIDITHERYKEYFGADFSKLISGIFSDEPNFCDFFANYTEGKPWLPWTLSFPDYFLQKRGYSIIPLLPLLFLKGENSEKVRHDYWRSLTELFAESYSKQISEWCEGNDIELCGHQLFENSLGYQVRACGAVMPQLRYYHIPGIDILGDQIQEYLTVKQCTSVARQMGRKTISETYGCTGWQFTFEGQKRLWDWQSVLGINIRSQHLSQYTIKGLRKRDYPPVFSYQSDSYRYANVIEDYCARLSAYCSAGKSTCEILIIHPISGIWTQSGSKVSEDLAEYDSNMGWMCEHILENNAKGEPFRLFLENLSKAGIDYDLGDEIIMSDIANVSNGKMVIGEAKYSVVVIPDTVSIFSSTLDLLGKFSSEGGKVFYTKNYPRMLDGNEESFEINGAEKFIDYTEAVECLKCYRHSYFTDIHTSVDAPILQNLRELDDGCVILAVNTDNKDYCCIFNTRHDGRITLIDTFTGRREAVVTNARGQCYLEFKQYESKIIEIKYGEKLIEEYIKIPYIDPHQTIPYIECLGPSASFSRTLDNALVLDTCKVRTADFSTGYMQVWQVQRALRDRFGFKQIFGNGVPMRYMWIESDKRSFPIELEFEFYIKDVPGKDIYLVLEDADKYKVYCNEFACDLTEQWYIDKSMKKVKLAKITSGRNRIIMTCDYSCDYELEDVYIVGDFAVDVDNNIINEPTKLYIGDWCFQGYKNYPGSIIYHYSFESLKQPASLIMAEWSGVLATVCVNGNRHFVPWQNDQAIEIELVDGTNIIDVEVVGSNRNLFGPLHSKLAPRSRIGWEDFRTEGKEFSNDMHLKPYGLFGQVIIRGNMEPQYYYL